MRSPLSPIERSVATLDEDSLLTVYVDGQPADGQCVTISHVLSNHAKGLAKALTKSCRNRAAGAPSTMR